VGVDSGADVASAVTRAAECVVADPAVDLIALRRHLHAHPELGRAEHATTRLVCDRLAAVGLAPRVLPGGLGVVCDVGRADGPLVALRADLDALPITDLTNAEYRSTVAGVSHACGHDVHTTIVVGTALALASVADRLPGRVRLLFQPAEELIPGGALDVLDAGALDGVRAIFAVHCDPRLRVGEVGVLAGPITAAADVVEVRLAGPGGHTARPHLTVDVVAVLARIVSAVPAGLNRVMPDGSGTSLVFGSIHAGSAANVIPADGFVRGTLRSLDRDGWDRAPAEVEALVRSIAADYPDLRAEVAVERGVPPVVNDAWATEVVAGAGRAVLGDAAVVPTSQSLGGEDFAWYLERIPGSLARLGVRGERPVGDLHSSRFEPDEAAIGVGVGLLARTAVTALHDLGRSNGTNVANH
jgi:amidohydrolase